MFTLIGSLIVGAVTGIAKARTEQKKIDKAIEQGTCHNSIFNTETEKPSICVHFDPSNPFPHSK